MGNDHDSARAARELLLDSFGRVRELVAQVTDGLTDPVSAYRPDPEANPVAWLVWHLTRVQDGHINEVAGGEQLWDSAGWVERFRLPFDASATGYGQSSDEVGKVSAPAELLDGYQSAVHDRTIAYVESLTAEDLARVVDERWDPPVTLSARLVSVIGDCLQHLGQAAYVRGLAERALS